MANILEVTEADNRGTEDVPYGFVYFSDDLRVAYTGIRAGDESTMTYTVTETSGGWGPITETHRRLAAQYLRDGT